MHTLGWLVWLGTAAAVVVSTRNPLILILLLVEFALILDRLSQMESAKAPVISPWGFALLAIPVGALFNGLTSHYGQTVLFHLPSSIPLIGGVVTAEALIYGAINGLVLTALFFAFTVLNSAVPVGSLIQYVPRAFYPFAVVSAIAVSFFPTTLRQIRQVKEAQLIRGHRMRGIKDWLPLFVPVLVGGLERALQLAEAMTSRGFAGVTDGQSSRDISVTLASVTGLLFILGAVVMLLLPAWASWSLLCLAIGVIAIAWAMWKAGRAVKRTRYFQSRWTAKDSLVVITGLIAAVPALIIKNTVLDYSPYPVLSWPALDLISGLALLGFVSPVWLAGNDAEVPG